MNPDYFYDGNNLFWRRADFGGIDYSDGVDEENRLYELIRNATDKSVFSEELFQGIGDWSSEYHLSRSRHCLVRPLNIKPGAKVLELGCGCGAITRYLGETGAQVVAVEGGRKRARITAERCKDLPNVRVYLEDLLEFQIAEKFDWVLLVGVLEYASLYCRDPNPMQKYLKIASHHLSYKGKLVVAIENRLGLKYFNGCSEDHVGVPFYGLQDLYTDKTPKTPGKCELSGELGMAGFSRQSFYYPFPDYKLPSTIIHESAFRIRDFNIPDLLLRYPGRDYSGSPYRLFNEALVLRSLHKNGLLQQFSNSFLIMARKYDQPLPESRQIAWSFAVQRRPEFATETAISRADSSILVEKNRLFKNYPSVKRKFQNMSLALEPEKSEYVCGDLLYWRFIKVSHSRGSADEMARALAPWFDLLLDRSDVGSLQESTDRTEPTDLSELTIDGALVDCVPFNLIENSRGLHIIDNEWRLDGRLPLGFVVTRGVLGCVLGVFTSSVSETVGELVRSLCNLKNFSVRAGDVNGWLRQEQLFQRVVTGKNTPESIFSEGNYIDAIDELHKCKGRLDLLDNMASNNLEDRESRIDECLTYHGVSQVIDPIEIQLSESFEQPDESEIEDSRISSRISKDFDRGHEMLSGS